MNLDLKTDVFADEDKQQLSSSLDRLLERRVAEANRGDIAAWEGVRSLGDWEAFKRPRIEALKLSLGAFPKPAKSVACEVTGTIDAEGYVIDKLVFESRPGLVVTANVYRPVGYSNGVGIMLVHSHHNPRTQPELQDMGAMWARVGCTVLVMDLFAYGERREHTAGPRHDYWNRYNTGVQLQLIGDSLMGWMVWDLRRGIDVLEQQYKANRVVMMGSVAGGGDPCAVAAALDDRVTVTIPFNFGGPQPETEYPLPDDVERSFNYLGTGGWETTRNLVWSGRDGFLPWVIVGSIAPRKLIYAHEFSWDQEHDPVWKRLQTIYGWYDANGDLDYAHGFGLLKGRPPHASHCNNVGAAHRERIHAALERWLGISVPDDREDRRDEGELFCYGGESKTLTRRRLSATLGINSVTKKTEEEDWTGLSLVGMQKCTYRDVIAQIGQGRVGAFRQSMEGLSKMAGQERLREAWRVRLGDVAPDLNPKVVCYREEGVEGMTVERFGLQLLDEITLPVVLIRKGKQKAVTVLLAQQGKAAVARHAGERIESLLQERAVCLVDVRGTGEIGCDEPRAARGRASGRAATALMVGESILGMQIRDLRSVIGYLRTVEMEDVEIEDVQIEGRGDEGGGGGILAYRLEEPMGGIVGYLAALFEEGVTAGEMPDARGQLRNQIVGWPMDAVVPGMTTILRIDPPSPKASEDEG